MMRIIVLILHSYICTFRAEEIKCSSFFCQLCFFSLTKLLSVFCFDIHFPPFIFQILHVCNLCKVYSVQCTYCTYKVQDWGYTRLTCVFCVWDRKKSSCVVIFEYVIKLFMMTPITFLLCSACVCAGGRAALNIGYILYCVYCILHIVYRHDCCENKKYDENFIH